MRAYLLFRRTEPWYAFVTQRLMPPFVVGRQGVTKEDAAAWVAEFPDLGKQGRYFFSLNRYLFAAEKPGAP